MPMKMNDQVQARLDKLKKIKDSNINPYPYSFKVSHCSDQLQADKEKLLDSEEQISYAGRIVRFNRKGKMAFMHVKDEVGRLQSLIARDIVGLENYELVKLLDMGDWVGINGNMMVTGRGEYTILAKEITLLSKAVRPLPIPKEKMENGKKIIYDEFTDKETRYRRRYVDLALNDNVREVFYQRTKIIQTIREYLCNKNYMEVETPVLQSIYGGANARPFTTHHNSQNMELYLRISNELYLKRCITGGFSRVFEFSRNFRNEGMDSTHNPEFTVLEFYEAYADYNDMMTHFEELYAASAKAIHGTTVITYQGTEIDLKPPWPRLTMKEAIKKYAGIDVDSMTDDELQGQLEKTEIELKGGYLRGLAIQALFEELCEEHLIQPIFIIDHPKESTPLCKVHREDNTLVERFEPYINGWEVGNAYSELNDPLVQRASLEEQVERGRAGEDETHPLDEDFLLCLEYGMPPIGGVGIGIDRLVMLLTDSSNIKDVLLFPLMKPE
ncbi:MAG: lysine--tRNA ligase [Fibrobacteria bacterium]|nr:lysine--tRNA ligase [Fibrobacteria bacterium]